MNSQRAALEAIELLRELKSEISKQEENLIEVTPSSEEEDILDLEIVLEALKQTQLSLSLQMSDIDNLISELEEI